MGRLTPVLEQYLEIKREHPDCVLFFRMGDFYEMFFEDALQASPLLGIALTTRDKGKENPIPMCGVPFETAPAYAAKLLARGLRVALCEQVGRPDDGGMFRRAVVRILTPGTVTEPEVLEAREPSYIASLWAGGDRLGLAWLDVSTGEFRTLERGDLSGLREDLTRLQPRELLVPRSLASDPLVADLGTALPGVCVTGVEEASFDPARARELLTRQLGTLDLSGFGLAEAREAVQAAGALLAYARATHGGELKSIDRIRRVDPEESLILDGPTLRNLEVVRSLRGEVQGSLLGVMDRTETAPGARTLRGWLLKPLRRVPEIRLRLGAVRELKERRREREEIRGILRGLPDLERLGVRVILGEARPREMGGLRDALLKMPDLARRLSALDAPLWSALARSLEGTESLAGLLDRALVPSPPAAVGDGPVFREGWNEELDRARATTREGKDWIARLEARERRGTGIATLKVGYNQVFGYYLEVTRPHLARVPASYERRQTLTGAERFVTPELKEWESKVLGAEARALDLEGKLYEELRTRVGSERDLLGRLGESLGGADALASLATVADERGYVEPTVGDDSEELFLVEGRHPVVESAVGRDRFIPNDLRMDTAAEQVLILTGPNMAGKSTLLRQVGLIALLAQTGSFVPAREARVGTIDRIFTRVGATDDLVRGQSTFMVEMAETANILHTATRKSLVLLDEIGRGTATYDGLSIAWAVAEHLHDRIGAKTLFATHYHELTELAATRPRVRNYSVSVKEWNDQILFLRRLVPGGANRSFGIQVARLAGLPREVLDRARVLLGRLEGAPRDPEGAPRFAEGSGTTGQLDLFGGRAEPLLGEIAGRDLSRMTPIEALQWLSDLQARLKKDRA